MNPTRSIPTAHSRPYSRSRFSMSENKKKESALVISELRTFAVSYSADILEARSGKWTRPASMARYRSSTRHRPGGSGVCTAPVLRHTVRCTRVRQHEWEDIACDAQSDKSRCTSQRSQFDIVWGRQNLVETPTENLYDNNVQVLVCMLLK